MIPIGVDAHFVFENQVLFSPKKLEFQIHKNLPATPFHTNHFG